MLGTRIIAGISMIAITVAILVIDQRLAPWFPFWLLLAITATGLASRELIDLLGDTEIDPSANAVVGGTMVVVASNWIPHLGGHLLHDERYSQLAIALGDPLSVLAWVFVVYIGVVMSCFALEGLQFERPGRSVSTIAGSIFAITYIGLLGSFMIQMRWLDGRGSGLLPIAYLIAAAKGGDIGAYLTGRMIGRHKLCPQLSPNKTIEGAIGGLMFSVGATLLVSWIARDRFELPSLDPTFSVVFGLLVGIVAQIGDLMESMIKRDCRRKDASSSVPGFGGVLDVLDSLLFAAPVAYLFWLCVGA
jgi:phosphatidate cytidylyltransferase